MILTLAACGKSEEAGSSPALSSAPAEATPVPEFVYKSDFKTLIEGGHVFYSPCRYTEDGVYAIGDEVIGRSAPEDAIEQWVGQFDITQPMIWFIDYEGGVSKLENFVPIEIPEAEEGQYEYDAFVYIKNLNVKDNGNLITLESVSISWFDEEGITWESPDADQHYKFTETNIIRELDPTGAEIGRVELAASDQDDSLYSDCSLDADGNVLTCYIENWSNYTIQGVNPVSGEIVYSIPCDNYIDQFCTLEDGSVYAMMWGDTSIELKRIDFENKKFGEGIALPGGAGNTYTGGGDYPIYYTSGVNFFGFDPETGESEKLFSWLDCDVNSEQMYQRIGVDKNGVVRALVSEYDYSEWTYDVNLITLSKVPYDPANQKSELTLAAQYISWELQNAVIDFNRKHDDIRIVVKDYSEYNTEEDYSAGIQKLNTEMISGSMPDIVCLDGLDYDQLAGKGLFEDLYPFIDADSELSRDAFFENILAAMETDGKLCRTVSTMYLSTVIGLQQLVGDQPGWTYDQFNAAFNDFRSMAEDDATAFDISTTRDEMLINCLQLDMNDFVDWSTGEVDFDNDEFRSLLAFANSFPASFNWDDYDYNDSSEVRISQGRQMLYRSVISSVSELMYIEACFHGAPITFIGFPTTNGVGNTITTDSGYAMTTTCRNKDAAWEFMRYFMLDDYAAMQYGLSVRKDIFEKSIKDACTVQYQIEDGEYVLDENGERIVEPQYFAYGEEAYSTDCLSQEIADAFRDAITSCDKASSTKQEIIDVVQEEAQAYFSGQQSLDKVVDVIQSKLYIYVNEQR